MAKVKKTSLTQKGKLKNKNEIEMPKKKHSFLRIFLILLIIIILISVIFGVFKYIDKEKEKSYLLGGNEAINNIIDEIKNNGGVFLRNGEKILVLSLYEKEIDGLKTNLRIFGDEVSEESNEVSEEVNEVSEESD